MASQADQSGPSSTFISWIHDILRNLKHSCRKEQACKNRAKCPQEPASPPTIANIWDPNNLSSKTKYGCRTHERHNGYLGRFWDDVHGNLALKTCVEEILGFELSKELPTSDWKAKKLTDAQIECERWARWHHMYQAIYEVLMDTLDRKGVEIGQDIPAAWYMLNNKFKFGEPTKTKLGWDGSEVTWRTSD
ncbi:hypothetical protein DFH09DRAFT_1104361 [Mycena vulgaris]|nr:hypothetical protein DFH09DRAFT_1104361 [Mycena vulgaris]